MERRKFIKSSALVAGLPLTAVGMNNFSKIENEEKEVYEVRTYEIRFRGNKKMLMMYFEEILRPSLERYGVKNFMLLKEYGLAEPGKIWVIITYPDFMSYWKAQTLSSDEEFIALSKEYDAISPEDRIYNRFSSFLLYAFDGMPQMKRAEEAGLYELRIYEGYNEDAVRRKIMMFNKEEIELFLKIGLNPSFFGDMIIGPYRPCLAYMLNFKSMEERNKRWKEFLGHPEWKAMLKKEEYLNTVSNIRKIFLLPV